jgi:hypothetical protein
LDVSKYISGKVVEVDSTVTEISLAKLGLPNDAKLNQSIAASARGLECYSYIFIRDLLYARPRPDSCALTLPNKGMIIATC